MGDNIIIITSVINLYGNKYTHGCSIEIRIATEL